MYLRSLKGLIEKRLKDNKIIILTGPRQVGKTTLIEGILSSKEFLEINGDDVTDRSYFEMVSVEKLISIIGNHKYVFIDEAQKIQDIGNALKLLHDKLKTVKVLVTGSSSFEINQQTSEALTGRKWEFTLLPVSWHEFEHKHGVLTAQKQLELRMVYGMYPEVLNQTEDQAEILKSITSSYLYKDILALGNIKKPELLDKILRALAYQVGSEVSYNEVAQLVGADKNTISTYIELLCKTYVIFKLPAFSRNLRNEIKTSQKIYFYDNGIRNAIIGNLNPLPMRNDVGQLWENFIISERMKYNLYHRRLVNMHFWRTTTQREIDFVEDGEGKISAFEFKWFAFKKVKLDKEFQQVYDTNIKVIDRENFREFVL
ncbi:MAG: ATP-binding protein [Saprospiraceae bacterium]|nr:ATP-binding protein [Saprospiraceae bacterium]